MVFVYDVLDLEHAFYLKKKHSVEIVCLKDLVHTFYINHTAVFFQFELAKMLAR